MPGTPTNPPTAMVAASMPVAKPTGRVNHSEMRMPERRKVIMGGSSMACRRRARGAVVSTPPQRAQRSASRMT